MTKRRMLWQSSTVIARFPDYRDAILRHAGKVLGPSWEVEVRGVDKGTPDLHFMAFDFLNNFQIYKSVTAAQPQGFDAVAIGCFVDPILDELREVMRIPVLSLAETGMLTACTLGRRFSIVSYVPQLVRKRYAELVHKYGLGERSAGLTSFELPFEELEKGYRNPGSVIDRFRTAAREAIRRGAEVLLPGCGSLNLILAENGVSDVDGATVLDVSGALMKSTEMMVVLGQVSGTRVSRCGLYEAPCEKSIAAVTRQYLTP